MIPKSPRLARWLANTGSQQFSLYCIAAAFSTYFCMYAFRKPFTAGEFLDVTVGPLPFKPVLVAVQVLGYTVAKFLGIKYVSEVRPEKRAIAIILLIMGAEVSLLLFGLTPRPYNAVWMFFNGLSLGMVFGFVVVFLEGRKMSEALVAGLCASFIISSGYVKSAGRYLIEWGVSEYWMPSATGLFFVVPLLIAVWFLNHLPDPNAVDVSLRAKRSTMDSKARWDFYRRHSFGLTLILLPFMALTVIRGIRDDFAVEIYKQLGYSGDSSVFARAETWVMFGVVIVNGATILIKDNRKALISSLVVSGFGFALALFVVLRHKLNLDAPEAQVDSNAFWFMVLVGLGLNFPYIAVHTTIFERLIASFRETATLGFLMCLADALGYLTYVTVVFWDNFGKTELDYLSLLKRSVVLISGASFMLMSVLIVHYWRVIPRSTTESQDLKETAE